MALELHVSGPGLEFTRRLQMGDPAIILGRDADCTICLPDPERNVSRRHLSVWNERDELHFHVLSVVNGVDLPTGAVPPGGSGTVGIGQSLLIAAYRVTVSVVSPDDDDTADPWAALERAAAATAPLPRSALEPPSDAAPASEEDDPFGDWGFGSTFGPGSPGGPLQADALAAAVDLQPFFQGLGIDASRVGALSQGELEGIGRLTRIAVVALLQASQSAAATRHDVHGEERTVLGAGREGNPLQVEGSLESKLYYLFGGRAAAGGFMAPDRALGELASELLAHQAALGPATRRAVEAVVAEFDPEALKARLLGGGARLFESSRAWDAFARDYGEQRLDPRWVDRLLDKHFVDAYLSEFMRVKRETSSRRK